MEFFQSFCLHFGRKHNCLYKAFSLAFYLAEINYEPLHSKIMMSHKKIINVLFVSIDRLIENERKLKKKNEQLYHEVEV